MFYRVNEPRSDDWSIKTGATCYKPFATLSEVATLQVGYLEGGINRATRIDISLDPSHFPRSECYTRLISVE